MALGEIYAVLELSEAALKMLEFVEGALAVFKELCVLPRQPPLATEE